LPGVRCSTWNIASLVLTGPDLVSQAAGDLCRALLYAIP
jgi:hypothetical protein